MRRPLCSLRTTMHSRPNLCSLTEIPLRRFAKFRKRTLYPVNEQRAAGQLIYTSFFFVDVLETQLGELCRECLFVSEAAQVEDKGVVLYASDNRNR